MLKEAIRKLKTGRDLEAEEMEKAFEEIMGGQAGRDAIKSFLISLADKGETIDEITAAAGVMREKMTRIELAYKTVLDTCGTGGGRSSFNVSTAAALVAAGAGIKVAKHGNRSYTSHCGSADVLEHLGVNIDIAPERVVSCIQKVGMGFLFAPLYHPAMKYVIGARHEIKRRTIFNILGPLCNPASANVQVIGTFENNLTAILAGALNNLKIKRAFVVHGLDGFDEVSISDESIISEVSNGKVNTYKVRPEDFTIKRAGSEAVACRDLNDNVKALKSILDDKKSPERDMVLVNTSLALVAAGCSGNFKDGVKTAAQSIRTGSARRVLERLIEFTNS